MSEVALPAHSERQAGHSGFIILTAPRGHMVMAPLTYSPAAGLRSTCWGSVELSDS